MYGNQTELGSLNILIVSSKPHAVQVLRHVLTINGIAHIQVAASAQAGLDVLSSARVNAVFCDDSCGEIGGRSFAFVMRRNAAVPNPMMPLFLMCGGPRQRDVERARDTGYTDVLTRPISAATIARKLKQVVEYPRPFIAAPDFFGPDRRSTRRLIPFRGEDRRKRSARKVKVAAPADNFVEI
jgi:CheY-like chemotaxis protein